MTLAWAWIISILYTALLIHNTHSVHSWTSCTAVHPYNSFLSYCTWIIDHAFSLKYSGTTHIQCTPIISLGWKMPSLCALQHSIDDYIIKRMIKYSTLTKWITNTTVINMYNNASAALEGLHLCSSVASHLESVLQATWMSVISMGHRGFGTRETI